VMEAPKKSDLIGCIGLELYGNQGLLRSLAVKKHYQGNGVGLRLIEKVLEEAKLNRVLELYLLTEGAGHYFKKKFEFVSFSPQEKFSFQGPVTQSKEFQEACPESAILMKMIVNSTFER
jgi:amino-acid N-acetyltransferase